MPNTSSATLKRHVSQWKHNREFLASIEPDYPDWMVTVAFYIALHAVDTLLAYDKQSPVSHATRNGILMGVSKYEHIWAHYRPLYDLSQTVRYQVEPSRWVPLQDIDAKILRQRLYPIEKSVCKLARLNVDLPPIVLKSVGGR